MPDERVNIEWMDVEGYLNSKGIPISYKGKNIQSGWIGINCLWCDDPSNHLGIDLKSKGFNCFRCPAKGTIINIVMKLERKSLTEALNVIKSFTHRDIALADRSLKELQTPNSHRQTQLPSLSYDSYTDYHSEYLQGRGFDIDFLSRKYKLKYTGPLGDYRMRIVVPIYMRKRLVSFTTRDVTGISPVPWIHGKPEEVIYNPKDCLYNYDSVEDTALVVEGVTDVWNMGDGAVGTFGDKYTKKQVYLLSNFKRVIILFDQEPEAQQNAEKLAYDVSTTVSDVHIYQLEKGDPGELSKDDVSAIRLEIFGRKYY